jgi:hypothetical protein
MTIEENTFYTKKGHYESRKDLLIHYLKVLYESNKPITLSDLFLDNIPGGGMPEFESVMNELELKNWIISSDHDGGPVSALPIYRKVVKTYAISLEGEEYLAAIGVINQKHKNKTNNPENTITNYGNMVIGNHSNEITQTSSDLEFKTKFTNNKLDKTNIIATAIGIVLTIIGLIIGYLQLVK